MSEPYNIKWEVLNIFFCYKDSVFFRNIMNMVFQRLLYSNLLMSAMIHQLQLCIEERIGVVVFYLVCVVLKGK